MKPSFYRSISCALSALCETEPPVRPICLNSGRPWPRDRSPLPSFFTSVLLIFAVTFFLYSVPLAWLFHRIKGYPVQPEHKHYSVVIYKLQTPDLAPFLPVERPPGTGGAPGSPASAGRREPKGSATWDSRVSVVSNPKQPDNFHQTILQPASPPKVKLLEDVQLPDLVIPAAPVAPTPLPQLAMTPPQALEAPVMPAIAKPLPMRPAPPAITPLPPAPLLALNEILTPPLPAPPAASKQVPAAPHQMVAAQASPPAKLLSLSVSPAPLKTVLALPLGNRQGAFSISPAGSHQGSPGGAPGSHAGAGNKGAGPGGDVSIGAGPGGQGGAAGSSETGEALSILGGFPGTSPSAGGTLPPLDAEALVYPVNSAPPPRQPALVVSTGPGGGGGLGVYGVLQCGRISTIYLHMVPKNWILQFCAPEIDPPSVASSRVVEIRMEPSLTPPAAVHKFDFHRPTFSGDKGGQMVILLGTIRKDGSVGGLQILRGVEATVNQAAMAAFARWKFSPALRGGKSVAVEILVGIPIM